MILELALCVTIIYLIWDYVRKLQEKFEKAGIPYAKPVWLVGNLWRSLFRKNHLLEDIDAVYRQGDGKKYIGLYTLHLPLLVIRDPQLIKQITVKDFEFFPDHHGSEEDFQIDKLFGMSLINLKGQKWKDMRAALSPLFTSSKIKDMCLFASECGEQMATYLARECKENGNQSVEVEMKDLSTRFMTDVIASTVYGIKTDSFKEKTNEFFVTGKKLTTFGGWVFAKMIFAMILPKLGKLLNIQAFDEASKKFFRELVVGGIKHRQENNIVRRDMLQLLMEAKEGSLTHDKSENKTQDAGFATVEESEIGTKDFKRTWTDEELVAQTMLFFFAGFETASSLVSFVLYELALNPELQEKLQQEIDYSVQQNGFVVNYNMIQHLKYLDMVISETLRLWPTGVTLDRMCVKDIDIGPAVDGQRTSYTVKQKDFLLIPGFSIHRDSKHWPDPLKFDPERFSDENKNNIQPFTYLPFGLGPRNCIGSRFALMESKVFVYHLIASFKVEVCAKTPIPFEIDNKSPFLNSRKGFWLKVTSRNKKP